MVRILSLVFLLFLNLDCKKGEDKKTFYHEPKNKFLFKAPESRLGLHITREELEIWRLRAKEGPYRLPGDVSMNSPGDWKRITDNAEEFFRKPHQDKWVGSLKEGCVQQFSEEPKYHGLNLRDAAFVCLVTGNKKYLEAVKKGLLTQALDPLTDFSNDKRWCDGVFRDINPGFLIAEWLIKLLFAYDYIKGHFSPSEQAILNNWFRTAAYYFKRNIDGDFNLVFADRYKNNYTLNPYTRAVKIEKATSVSHENGRAIPNLAKWYNNRKASMVRLIGFTGIFLDDKELKITAKLFVKEWLIYSVFPDGVIGEFERWAGDLPDLGWGYSSLMISQMAEIADAFARDGDMELYYYKTSKGLFGTAGGEKTIFLTVQNLFKYLDGSVKRKIPEKNLKKSVVKSAVIDGIVEEKNWFTVNDCWFSQCNIFYRNTDIQQNYLRTKENRLPYPTKEQTATMGHHHPWSGTWAIYPGVLFMFGKMENKVWPYPEEAKNLKL